MQFIDIGFNITDDMFAGRYRGSRKHDSDLEGVIERARENGVTYFLCTGTDCKESAEAIALCRKFNAKWEKPCCFATVGIHPTSSTKYRGEESLSELRKLVEENRDIVKAFGELGLDAERTSWADLETQERAFKEQLMLAYELGLPLFLHNRKTTVRFCEILEETTEMYKLKASETKLKASDMEASDMGSSDIPWGSCVTGSGLLPVSGVVHSFDGARDDARRFIRLGLHIGVNGCGLRELCLHEVIRAGEIPVERLHFETDAPWCSIKKTHPSFDLIKWEIENLPVVKPEKHQSNVEEMVKGRCEPMHVRQVAECLYRLHEQGEPTREKYAQFCERIYRNSLQLFRF
ncbi:putative TatD family hydrolase [Gregarina niphandrodes]|uniref:TatD family hydrolase n=1 Tax=Gregarina niphandrodes TaxID=110365 RepID=A0A023AYV1_GRENI|nr:putative TatD family hydrolase [Gregarina niphandrodes]EZG43633.1 putative TatD family hydrolase [Gregarina niphandrodes]|eukprot:XP_011133136.1 putative TatD family hydrolase [Gregarina niphandrodes]